MWVTRGSRVLTTITDLFLSEFLGAIDVGVITDSEYARSIFVRIEIRGMIIVRQVQQLFV